MSLEKAHNRDQQKFHKNVHQELNKKNMDSDEEILDKVDLIGALTNEGFENDQNEKGIFF